MVKNEVLQRYYLIDGNVLEFSNKEALEQWIQDYINKNPGKGLAIPEGTKRTMVVLGNEVGLKTEVIKEIQQVEVQKLKVELGGVKNI